MVRGIRQLLGHLVLADDGPVGRICDVIFDDKTWNMGYLCVDSANDGRDIRYVLAWEIKSIDYDAAAVSIAIGKNELVHSIEAGKVKARGQFRSALDFFGYKVIVEGELIGQVDDLVLGDDSWVLDSIAVRSMKVPRSAPFLHNINRIERIDEKAGAIILDKYEPFFFDTPANVWQQDRKDEQYMHDRGLTYGEY